MPTTAETRRFRDLVRLWLPFAGVRVEMYPAGMAQPDVKGVPVSITASAARPRGLKEMASAADARACDENTAAGVWLCPSPSDASGGAVLDDVVAVMSLRSFAQVLVMIQGGDLDPLASIIHGDDLDAVRAAAEDADAEGADDGES